MTNASTATAPLPSDPSLPPGPKGRKLRNANRLLRERAAFMDQLHAEYGDIAFWEIPGRQCAAVFGAETIREVLVEQEPHFQPFYGETSFNLIPSPCLATSRFEIHEDLEKVMSGAFTPDRIAIYSREITRNAHLFHDRLSQQKTVDFKTEAERFTWASLLDTVIGVEFQVDPDLGKSVLDAMKSDMTLALLPGGMLLKRLPLPHNLRTARQIKALDDETYKSIRRARETGEGGENVIAHFVQCSEAGMKTALADDSEIRDEAYTLMFGAVDAPTGTLTHCINFLARNPLARERLEQEVDEVLEGRPIAPDDLERLPYAQAVFQETLRLEPPAYVLIPRETIEDRVVGGHLVPKGTLMHVCLRTLHRRQDYWEAGGAFRPDRWLEDAEQGGSRCPAHSYIPFSVKPRICQGVDFGRILVISGIVSLVQRLRLEPEPGAMPKRANVGVGLVGSFPVRIKQRSPTASR